MTTILAIDQGTTSTKALLVDRSGQTVASADVAVRRSYPRPGWVEQDPAELWQSVLTAIERLPDADPTCIAVTNQRESVLMWDRATGRPLTPCVSWQCNRGAEVCAELLATGAAASVRDLTGLPLEPMFSAPKLRQMFDADPALYAAAQAGSLCVGTVDSWIVWNLSRGDAHLTDAGNAARTLLFDVQRLQWSDELLALFDVPAVCLPRVVPSSAVLAEATAVGRLGSLPIAAVAADSHAALYALGCSRPGSVKATYGTGTSLMRSTGGELRHSHSGLATTLAWLSATPTYALEGNIVSSGATVDWVAGMIGAADSAAVAELARTVPDADGVYMVPAFSGLGAPHWEPDARGCITGLTFGSGPAHLARAAVDSIAYQVADLVSALEQDLEQPLAELRVDGGASRNDSLMQLQADLLGCSVLRTNISDAAAVGVALLAGLSTGTFESDDEVASLDRRWDRFEPRIGESDRERMLAGWQAALASVRAVREAVLR
jgi:glycerol kinase